MKVFASLATVIGASSATQLFHNQFHQSNSLGTNQHSIRNKMRPTMSIGVDRHMDNMHPQASGMRNMYRDNHQMTSNMMNQNMMGQDMMDRSMMGQKMRSNMKDVHGQNQAFGPNQYFVKDNFGNYVYSYNDQQSEKSEEGNNQSIKGHYAYIMSNGVKRRVDYVANNQGFHVLRDNADPARIKRSIEPNLIQTRMTSVMDSSSLSPDMHRMPNMMGRDMSSEMDRNMMGMDQQRYSNMLMDRRNIMSQDGMELDIRGHDSMRRNMMGQDSMGRNIMSPNNRGGNMIGRNIYNTMSNRGMTSDVSKLMGRQMDSTMMGRDRTSQMTGRNMMLQQDMTPNRMYSNTMEMSNDQMSSNMMSGRAMSPNMMNSNNGLVGQRMMQKMEIGRVPETYTSARFF